LPHQKICHEYAQTSSDRKMHIQIDYILTNKIYHTSVVDVQYFRGADSGTDHYLVAAKVKETDCQ